MSTVNRWAEYEAGTLTPPVVVQHDVVTGEHLVWVWCTDLRIRGPLSPPAGATEADVLAYAEQLVVEDATRVPIVTADQMVALIKPFVKDAIADIEQLYADVQASSIGAGAKDSILAALTHIRGTLIDMRTTIKAEV